MPRTLLVPFLLLRCSLPRRCCCWLLHRISSYYFLAAYQLSINENPNTSRTSRTAVALRFATLRERIAPKPLFLRLCFCRGVLRLPLLSIFRLFSEPFRQCCRCSLFNTTGNTECRRTRESFEKTPDRSWLAGCQLPCLLLSSRGFVRDEKKLIKKNAKTAQNRSQLFTLQKRPQLKLLQRFRSTWRARDISYR